MTTQTENLNKLWSWEMILLGGGSIFTCIAMWAFMDRSASVYTISQLAAGLAFAVNHPHFLASYVLLYKDFQKNIFKQPKYFWAGVVAPAILFCFLAYSLFAGRGDLLGHLVNAMFFLVGWHYVKQVFGCVIVSSVRRRVFYSQMERRLILANLFSLWSISWLQSQVGSQTFGFYGITYSSLNLPRGLLVAAYTAVAVTALIVVVMHFRKYISQGTVPSVPGLAALLSLYVWYFPAFSHPGYAYLIPFFHSLQYLVFVWSFKANQVKDQMRTVKEAQKQRAIWAEQFLGYASGVIILGALFFEFIPKGLDNQFPLGQPMLGTAPFLAAFLLFINIHHYFIDNAIWRSQNEEVKKYLFTPQDVVEPAKYKKAG